VPPQMIAGERPILIVRQYWLVLVPHFVGAFVALIVGWVVIGLIPDEFLGHHVGGFRALFDLALLLLLAGVTVGAWLRWRYQSYMLTDHRIVASTGVVARQTESIALDRIQDIRVRQTLSRRMIHCGDVEIDVAGRDGSEVLDFILEPQAFMNELLSVIEAHRMGQYVPATQAALQRGLGPGGGGAPAAPPPGGPFGPMQPAAPSQPLFPTGGETAGDRFRRGGSAEPPPYGQQGPERPPAGPPQAPFDPRGPGDVGPQAPIPWRPPDDGGY